MAGEMTVSSDTQAMINARIAADRRAALRAAQRVLHHPEFQELEGSWRGLHYFVQQTETGTDAQGQGPERLEEGPAQGHGARRRVRPERAVQEGLRGGVRHLRRRPVRGDGRRLRVHPAPAGHRAAREDLERRRRGARPVPRGGQSPALQLGRLHRDGRPARPEQDLRDERLREMAVVPRVGGLRATSGSACRTS